MNHQLELTSSRGDDTFAALPYILCGVTSPAAAGAALVSGISTQEGAALVTTNLVHAMQQAGGETGRILVIRRPAQPTLGYATDTIATIDRQAKTVSGHPLAYAGGRNNLGWFTDSKLDAAHHLSLIIPAGYIAATIEVAPGLGSVLNRLEVAANALMPFDLAFVDTALNEAMTIAENFTQSSETQIAHSLTIATAEALVMSRLREMRWEGLTLLGYRFFEGDQPAIIKAPVTIEAHEQNLDHFEAQLKSDSLLTAELAWLKPHVTAAITMMRSELADALPEAAK